MPKSQSPAETELFVHPKTKAEIIRCAITRNAEDLFNRNWPEISIRLDEDDELKLTFNVTVTDRETEPGEQADKSHRVKTSISFAKRFTDSIETTLEDPDQLELLERPENGTAGVPNNEEKVPV